VIVSAAALALALNACAPEVHPETMSAIVEVESGGDPFAIHDNATDHAYLGLSREQAVSLAQRFLADGPDSERCQIARARHRYCSFDAGIAQINSSNFTHYHLSPETVFAPNVNLWAAGDLMYSAWQTAVHESRVRPSVWSRELATYGGAQGANQVVLRAAISIYNSNSAWGNPTYVGNVVNAISDRYVREVTVDALSMRSRHSVCYAHSVAEVQSQR
jgi:hypothetical protein